MYVQPNFEVVSGSDYDDHGFPWHTVHEQIARQPIAHRSYYQIRAASGEVVDCWSNSLAKRLFDVALASLGLAALSPVIAATALAIKVSSEGPVLFRQTRMGSHGRTFTILKFRTMQIGLADFGPSVTKAGDKRLTRIGSFLRKSKLDEFPQLINVIRGDMSLIGPRPKVPHHQTTMLHFRPGITGAASIAFRNEEQVLHRIPEKHLDDYQVHVLMPLKTELDESYMRNATLSSDVRMLFRTVFGGRPAGHSAGTQTAQHSLVLLKNALDHAANKSAHFAVDRAAS